MDTAFSGPNISDDRRNACVIRYIRPDLQQQVGEKDYAMLAGAEDWFGHFVHVPAPKENFSPTALALYDEMREAQSKVMMKGADARTEMFV